jgi:hypothetical protein
MYWVGLYRDFESFDARNGPNRNWNSLTMAEATSTCSTLGTMAPGLTLYIMNILRDVLRKAELNDVSLLTRPHALSTTERCGQHDGGVR